MNPTHDQSGSNARCHETRRKKHRKFTKRYLLRLDVCWTVVYFLFLAIVFTMTSAITRVKVDSAMRLTFHSLHETHLATISTRINNDFDRFYNIVVGYLSMHSKTRISKSNQEVMGTLCSLLVAFDTTHVIREVSTGTQRINAMTACMHNNQSLSSSTTLYGYVSNNSWIDGVYYVNNETYSFLEPLQKAIEWPLQLANVTSELQNLVATNPIFDQATALYNGSIQEIDKSLCWSSPPQAPHLLHLVFPSALLYKINNVPNDRDTSLFARLIVDTTRIMRVPSRVYNMNVTSLIFASSSLDSHDPLIISNNWGQKSVDNSDAIILDDAANLKYLSVSGISNPLMRAALKHVDLKALQRRGYNRSVDFQYNGAPATVTAIAFTPLLGPTLPIVYVSAQSDITPPYTRIMNICNGVAVAVLLLLTAAFWCFIHRYLSVPLQRVSELLEDSVEAGARATRSAQPSDACFQLSEVRTLMQASNDAMARVREIDAFVPEARLQQLQRARDADGAAVATQMAGMCSSMCDLTEQTLTIVYLRIRRVAGARATAGWRPAADVVVAAHSPTSGGGSPANPLRAIDSDASAPFPSRGSLADFVTAVQALTRIHHGAVHRLTPDSCILHFGRAARTHLFSYAAAAAAASLAESRSGRELAPEETLNAACVRREAVRCARQDAKDALQFALELQRWLDHYRAEPLPDVRALVDTGRFACGQYRPCGSEHTMSVAFGRDAERELGGVPALIGVRVAMTEETAGRVRAGVQRGMCSTVEAGVRQLPVEALRTGRVGLDANVVILYEALPGPVVGNAAWQRYSRCCFDGFGAMLRGDYAGALSAYKAVADISDLEPGLMPRSLRREAASSSVAGGAVSVQAARLIAECERRLAAGITRGYYRERHVPLGIDAVLGDTLARRQQQQQQTQEPSDTAENGSDGSVSSSTAVVSTAPRSTRLNASASTAVPADGAAVVSPQCHPAVLPTAAASLSACEAGLPDSLTDSNGMRWYLPRCADHVQRAARTGAPLMVLGSAGALCALRVRAFSDQPRAAAAAAVVGVPDAAADAPLDTLLDAPEATTPRDPRTTATQRAQVAQLFRAYQPLRHCNIAVPLSYAFAGDDGVAGVWDLPFGGTLRDLYARFPLVRPVTVVRLHICVLTGLLHLHAKGVVHGAVSLDSVVMGANGHCRLVVSPASSPAHDALLVARRSCYVSPQMAAGAAPTPACDVFCYALMCLEAVTRRPAWRWAATEEGLPQRTERDLRALMAEAGPAFNDALVQGRVVPAVKRLEEQSFRGLYSAEAKAITYRALDYDPAKRPSLVELWELSKFKLASRGMTLQKFAGERDF